MEIYNGNMERIENPDLSLGYLVPGKRTEHHAAVQGVTEQWHYETVAEYPNGGKDIRRVVDVPGVEARDAWDEEIAIQVYTPYTQEELDRMEAERNKPTTEERLAALEEENRQLKEALELLLSGATEGANTNA
ncbi:MAG: hypothetical protein SOY30_15215 [Eubacteriales bacterium]|nr:hypothetical protein [Eubacteriales bacterium]